MKIFRYSVLAFVAAFGIALQPASVDAQVRQNTLNRHQSPAGQATRPASRPSAQPSQTQSTRPGATTPSVRPGAGQSNRPTTTTPSVRPGAQPQKPTAQPPRPSTQPPRPSTKPPQPTTVHPARPGIGYGDYRPGGRPGQRPLGYPPSYGVVPPAPTMWTRPALPPRWQARPGLPTFGNILGMAIGTTFANTLAYLASNNYTTVGYNTQQIVVSNVNAYGFNWPSARLLYNNGMLYGSQYESETNYNDSYRYSALYNSFTNSYGLPVSTNNTTTQNSATWFCAGGEFITLTYSVVNVSGYPRYYTTVSVGQ